MSVTTPLSTPPLSSRLSGICAYCAERATHRVTGLDDHGRILGVGYCCSEPTHWAWLVDSVEQLEREDGPET